MMATLVLAEVPALPLHTAGRYVAAAYIVLFVIVLVYVAIMATRLRRMERELGELRERAADAGQPAVEPSGMGERESVAERESTPA